MYPAVAIMAFVVSYFYSDKRVRWLYKRSIGQKDQIAKHLELMFVDVNDKKLTWALILVSVGLGLIFFILLWPNIILGFIAGAVFTLIGWTIPKFIFAYL